VDRMSWLLKFAGYLVPLVQSLPPLGVWTGLMTVPLVAYLILILPSFWVSLPSALFSFFSSTDLLREKAFIVTGFICFIYSAVYLYVKGKGRTLVAIGPYRFMRHPQYLGLILFTLGLTSWSYWILTHTFGIGFLSPSMTVNVWVVELFVYVLLASIEESYLSKVYKEAFRKYERTVPFLIPFLKTKRKYLDIAFSIFISLVLLLYLIKT